VLNWHVCIWKRLPLSESGYNRSEHKLNSPFAL
jgi:hypothetical protein